MSELFTYMGDHAFMTFLLSFPVFIIACMALALTFILLSIVIKFPQRLLGSVNIWFRGYPPVHVNALGINGTETETAKKIVEKLKS